MRACIANVFFDDLTTGEAVVRTLQMARWTDCPRQACLATMEHLLLSESDPVYQSALSHADLVVPSAASLVWLSHVPGIHEGRLHHCVSRIVFYRQLCHAAADFGLRLFLLGGKPHAAGIAAAEIAAQYPQIEIPGLMSTDASALANPSERDRIVDAVVRAEPDILISGLGSFGDRWLAENRRLLGVPVSVDVGSALDFDSRSGYAGGDLKVLFPYLLRTLSSHSHGSWRQAA